MISIDIETKSGKLIKLSEEDAKEVYEALKRLMDNPLPVGTYPAAPNYPFWPYAPWTVTYDSTGRMII